jgi:hypothetical protein
MYDHDPADIAELGWDGFVEDVWQSIFVGYRGFTGIRTLGRRWSDLLQGGLGCTQELADELVRVQIMDMEGRTRLSSKDALVVLAGMDEVLADMSGDLAEMYGLTPAERDRLLAGMTRLRAFVRENSPGSQDVV